jgi:hypothetical protein
MESIIPEFLTASFLMGLAIGLDAAIATSGRARNLLDQRQALAWLAAITATHTLFPLVGYLGSYYGLQSQPALSPLIGVLAFALIAYFVLQELQTAKRSSVATDIPDLSSGWLVNGAMIVAVSWDALWSGPAKSAQVVDWPEVAIWASFVIVGLTVASLCSVALLAMRTVLCEVSFRYQRVLQWLQLTAISYFAWLALLRYTFASTLPALSILIVAGLLMAIALWFVRLEAERREHTAGLVTVSTFDE